MESLSFKPLWISEKLKAQEFNVSSFKDAEKLVKDGYLRNKNYQWSKELAMRQLNENNNLRNSLETNVLKESREILDKEALVQEAKNMLYEKLWVNENQAQNGAFENFLKWVVDELVIGNYELAIEIYETNWKVIIESLKQLASFEWIKKIAESLWETIWNLFDGNAYEKWKSTAQLWLISTGVVLWVTIWKRWLKMWMKELAKFRVNKETIVLSPNVKWVIKETNSKVGDILPKKQLDFGKMLIEDIAKLWNKERLEATSFYLKWKKFTPEQENAILAAHEVWLPKEGGKYTIWDLRKKYIILEKVGFTDSEIKTLMDNWVCGKEKLPKLWKSLLDEPKFSFLKKPEYKELLELYWWVIDREKLLWEWQNAIILQHPNKKNGILKVAKEWAKDDIVQEFKSHETFYNTLEQWKIDFKWQLSKKIKIPFVETWKWKNPVYFEMEKIDGQSFKSLFYKEKYKEQLEKAYTKNELAKMSDSKLEESVKNLWLDTVPTFIFNGDWGFSKALYNESQTFMWNKIRDPLKWKETELWNTLSFLDWKWLRHTDMHSGNFMLSRDWKTTYIIDFWNTNLNSNKK